jgi:predicted porin
LATTALVGASLLAAPANAGTVGSKDNMNVTLGGLFWFSAYIKEEDVSNTNGRGYGFTVSESEVHVRTSATADNGMKYGVHIELNAGAADNPAVDEAHVMIASPSWGTIELGDQDDATNRMQLGSWNATKGAGGPFGGLGDLNTVFNGNGTDTLQSRADWQVITTTDATKATYFSPRFSGFQIGASWTPDSGETSGGPATADADDDGDFENVIGLSANYVGKFDNVGVGLSIGWEHGDDEVANPQAIAPTTAEDLNIWGIGGKVDVAGFTIGAHYRDYGDTFLTAAQTAAGADSGDQWSLGVGYQAGPWGVSAWYLQGEKDNTNTSPAGAGETEIQRYGLGAGYAVAPGWQLRAELTFNNVDNATTAAGVGGTTDNDGKGFLLVNRFVF